jgi:Exopolysaccharide synthesis, ExoD
MRKRIIPVLSYLERFIRTRWPTPFEVTNRVIGGVVLILGVCLLAPLPLSNFLTAFAYWRTMAYCSRSPSRGASGGSSLRYNRRTSSSHCPRTKLGTSTVPSSDHRIRKTGALPSQMSSPYGNAFLERCLSMACR